MKIKLSQIGSVVYLVVLANYLGTTSGTIINMAKQDAWFSVLLAFIVGLIPIFIFIKIMDFKPDLNIAQKNVYIFGKVFGNFINILLMISTFIFLISIYWTTNNFIGSQYLHRTPTLLIGFCGATCIIYLLNNDIYTILRTLFILFIIGLSLYIFGSIGLINQFKMDNLKPFFENGLSNPLIAGFKTICYNIFPLFFITIFPKNSIENSNKLTKTILKSYFLGGSIMFFIILLTIGIFGPKLSELFQYTAYQLLKNISLFGFIDRIESIISIRWILYIVGFSVIASYFINTILNNMIKINKKVNIFLNFVLVISATILSEMIFNNHIDKQIFTSNILPFLSLISYFIIPIIILISSKLKKASV